MAAVYYPRDDDAVSVTSECTLPDAPVEFGAPLERMGYDHYALSAGKSFDTSYASSYYPSCEHLPSNCTDPDCECGEDAVFLGDEPDEETELSPCASSSSSLSEYFNQRRLSNAGDLAGVEHCNTPKATLRKFSTSFAAALAQGDALPQRPMSPEHPTVHNQRRIGTSDSHRHQLALARYLNADRTRSDPWNHTDPVIHIREHTIANRNAGATLVTERLHDWWAIPFANTHDSIDYAKQILEGVAFLHEHNITNLAEAVRPHNIQMDVGLAPLAPPAHSPKSGGKSASAPVTPATEPEDLPSVAWTRADYPVRYYFTALNGLHRVRRTTSDDSEHVTDEDEDDEMQELTEALDALSRPVDEEAWELSTAVDLVAVGNALDLVFGRMAFNPLRPIIQDLCDALDTPMSAHDALARVESLERTLSRQDLFSPLDQD